MFKEDGFDAMTKGVEYLVTYNGCHRGSYRGRDDNGTAFCYSDDVFYPIPVVSATQVTARNHSNAPHCIAQPSGDFTHMGRYQGPGTPGLTRDREYNLIHCSMSSTVAFVNDHGSWMSADEDMFRVTHDYGQPSRYSTNDAFGDDDDSMADMPAPPCGQTAAPADMTGIVRTLTEGTDAMFDDSVPWEDDEPSIKQEPASTEELREYRFKPNLF